MTFDDFVGYHTLSGVEETKIEIDDYWSGKIETNAIIIQLDGKNYAFVADPDDGYRSYCKDPVEVKQSPKYKFSNISVNVIVREEDDGWETDRLLVFNDVKNEKEVLIVGTDNYNDWYPCCRFEWHPENLSINS